MRPELFILHVSFKFKVIISLFHLVSSDWTHSENIVVLESGSEFDKNI